MNIEPEAVLLAVGIGLAGATLLTVVAWRAGDRLERNWRSLAARRGWRCEKPENPRISLRLHGTSGTVAWTCSIHTGASVHTAETPLSNITRLETIWSTRLPGAGLDGTLELYDNTQFTALRRITGSSLMGAMARVSPGLGGRALRAGLEAANVPALAVGGGHSALASSEAARRFIGDPEWQAAFLRFAAAHPGVQQRLHLGDNQLEIALLGSIRQPERLLRFIESCLPLAEATRRGLVNQASLARESSGNYNKTPGFRSC